MARETCCKMGRTGDFAQAPDFGYCASQNTYYFGYKLHALCGLTGVIHSYDLSKASIPDLDYMKDVKLSYHDCSIYGDKGYIGADVQLDLFETAHIRLECSYRVNQKDWKPTFIPLAHIRVVTCCWKLCSRNAITLSDNKEELRSAINKIAEETELDKLFAYGYGANHFWLKHRRLSNGETKEYRLLKVEF